MSPPARYLYPSSISSIELIINLLSLADSRHRDTVQKYNNNNNFKESSEKEIEKSMKQETMSRACQSQNINILIKLVRQIYILPFPSANA